MRKARPKTQPQGPPSGLSKTFKKPAKTTVFPLDTPGTVYYNEKAVTFETVADIPCPGDASYREMSNLFGEKK